MVQKEFLLNDAYFIKYPKFHDDRGFFQKVLTNAEYTISEQYYSKSNKNVLRGIHFQLPPFDHDKIVTCISGKAIDLIIDLRTNSETYLKYATINLNSENGVTVFIPKGFGHGFLSLEDETILLYNTSTSYSSSHDSGILWNSIDYKWPIEKPIISDRDRCLQNLENFNSPFIK